MPTLRRRTAEPSTSLPPTSLPRTRPALSMLTPMLPPPCVTASRAPCVLGRTATRRKRIQGPRLPWPCDSGVLPYARRTHTVQA
eukprot:scaffold36557_cov67-Phaeocystis_antarctica.AAC.1